MDKKTTKQPANRKLRKKLTDLIRQKIGRTTEDKKKKERDEVWQRWQ